MDGKQQRIIGNNQIEDVRWLCSLTEAELDMLIGLKSLVLRRAKQIGHVGLAKRFDLKMLQGLSLVLMENLKGQLKQQEIVPESTKSLLKSDPDENFATMELKELRKFVCNNREKRIADMFDEDMIPSKRQKTADGGSEQT